MPTSDLSPKRVNVKPGARPPVAAAVDKQGAAAPAGCGGVMKLLEVYSCSSLSGSRQDTFTVVTTVDDDVLHGTFTQVSNGENLDYAGAQVYDADGNYLCYFGTYPGTCQLGAAGTYTVLVALSWGVGDVAYTFAVQSRKTPAACRTLGNGFFSFASGGRAGDLVKGSAGDCYKFDQPAGTVLQMWPTNSTGDVRGEILDGSFQPVCPIRDAYQCTLTSPGPYHVMTYEGYGSAATYTLRMARITQSVGCPVLRPVPFGDPGSGAGTGSLAGQGTVACHKLRTPATGGVLVRIDEDQSIWWTVFDDAGRQVCDKHSNSWSCNLPAAGAYTVITSNQDWNSITYAIAVTALYRSAGCSTRTSLGWDQAASLLTATSGVQANCQQFRGTAGQRVVVYSSPITYNMVFTMLVDSTGQALCIVHSEETGCALPANGTYRAVSLLDRVPTESSYKVQVRSLTSPSGCPVVGVGAFNAPPAGAAGPIRCRTLRVTEAGILQIRLYDAENYRKYAAVYDRTGHRICNDSSYCEFTAAGDYTVVIDGQSPPVIDNDFVYVTSVLPARPAGCPVLSQELYKGAFTDPGQYFCVQLAQPAGARVAELVPADQLYPFTYVVDSAGNYLCDSTYQLRQTSCELTGTAPFFAILSEQEEQAPAPFAARFVRVDGPPSCPALDGTAVTTTADEFVVCRSIPADGHGATEAFSWRRVSGTGGAHLSVFDASGIRYCGPTGTYTERTATCRLPAGPLTVLLNAAGADATYELSHQAAGTS
ncbi:hypothetical protein [Paractinoplanes rishiriensis]|uniref:Uncharacterized protein n=1 Tax=Paractinoplanes rishiriensis TaxID=1050105 RepID=A0A919MUI5_9ACTN|nr:hypothetical protein [Actinoplanes rishiriensis]GIE95828.1 hypothetical protein Ari01nite_32930 [Actinoplanes rishiriensis]